MHDTRSMHLSLLDWIILLRVTSGKSANILSTLIPKTIFYLRVRNNVFYKPTSIFCRSQWPRSLRHEMSSPIRMLGSWVRIPLKAWMFACVCIGSGLAKGWSLIQGVLPIVLGLTNLSEKKAFHGCPMLQSGGNREERQISILQPRLLPSRRMKSECCVCRRLCIQILTFEQAEGFSRTFIWTLLQWRSSQCHIL
jgi:hypothetical protein